MGKVEKGAKKIEQGTFIVAFSVFEAGDKEIQLLPFGEVRSKKGTFKVDESSIESIMAAFEAETNDVVVDYEHQTLHDVIAPAAGWIKELINKGQDGLWGRVEWTPKAAEFLKNKEYRYLSPVVLLTKNKRVVALHSVALTNTPAIDGMMPLANKADFENGGENEMEEFLKKLAKMLGLAETATEDEVVAAVEKACAKPAETVANKEVLTLLGLKEDAKLTDVTAVIAGLKNPSGYVKAEEFKALKEKLELKERDDLVQLALSEGKLWPTQKAWAEGYALKDPAGFSQWKKDAPVVVPLKEIADGKEIKEKTPDELQLSINKALGINDEIYKKYGREA